MIKQLTTPRSIFVIVAVLLAAGSRILPHPFNFTPVLAMGLFAGATLSSFSLALFIPLAAMFLSDLVLGFHSTIWAVYFATALSSALGYVIRNRQNFVSISAMAITSALLFFLITNFAVWMAPTPELSYSKDFAGLAACYASAVPFFRSTLFSNLIYTGILFTAYYMTRELRPIRIRKDK